MAIKIIDPQAISNILSILWIGLIIVNKIQTSIWLIKLLHFIYLIIELIIIMAYLYVLISIGKFVLFEPAV